MSSPLLRRTWTVIALRLPKKEKMGIPKDAAFKRSGYLGADWYPTALLHISSAHRSR